MKDQAYRAARLDEYISFLKKEFPEFTYINSMKEECSEKHLIGEEYSIFVLGVTDKHSYKFSKFIFDEIYMLTPEQDPLPMIVPLQRLERT